MSARAETVARSTRPSALVLFLPSNGPAVERHVACIFNAVGHSEVARGRAQGRKREKASARGHLTWQRDAVAAAHGGLLLDDLREHSQKRDAKHLCAADAAG